MPRIRKLVPSFLVALGLALSLAPDAGAERRKLSPDALRAEAELALRSGYASIALGYAQALVARDAEDFEAQLLRARAAREIGAWDEASEAAATLRRLAKTNDLRFAAAMVSAQIASSRGNHMTAQLRLRQALEAAPNDRLKTIAARDYRYVRARNPWHVDLSFSVAPVSNINNGSRRSTGTIELPIFGEVDAQLSGSAVALSGTEYQSGLNLRYRLRGGSVRSQTDLILGLSRSDYSLSDEARDEAPDASGEDFAFASGRVILAHRGLSGSPKRPFQLALSFGRTWYGGTPYTQYVNLAALQSWSLDQKSAVSINARLKWEDALDSRTAYTEASQFGVGWRTTVGTSDHLLSLDLSHIRNSSRLSTLQYDGWIGSAQLRLGKPIWGVGLEFGIAAGEKNYERGPIAGEGRLDRIYAASATAEFRKLDYYGFIPTLTLFGERRESDYGQYDSDEIGVRFGVQSAF